MVMRVFDLSLNATVYWESDRRAFTDQLLLKGESTVKELTRTSGTEVTVFKAMNEMHDSLLWLKVFPNIRILWLVRSYNDVVNSSVRKFSSMRESLFRIVDDRKNSGWWGGGISDENFDFLREHCRQNMSLEDAYALFWIIRNSLYFELSLYSQTQVKICKYENLVNTPKRQFEDIFKFCGASYDARYTREIFGSSVGKNATPILSSAIEDRCIQIMDKLGYDSYGSA
jgi:Sulfotransferase family